MLALLLILLLVWLFCDSSIFKIVLTFIILAAVFYGLIHMVMWFGPAVLIGLVVLYVGYNVFMSFWAGKQIEKDYPEYFKKKK